MELQKDDLFSWETPVWWGLRSLPCARKAQRRATQPTEGTDGQHVQRRKSMGIFLSLAKLYPS